MPKNCTENRQHHDRCHIGEGHDDDYAQTEKDNETDEACHIGTGYRDFRHKVELIHRLFEALVVLEAGGQDETGITVATPTFRMPRQFTI